MNKTEKNNPQWTIRLPYQSEPIKVTEDEKQELIKKYGDEIVNEFHPIKLFELTLNNDNSITLTTQEKVTSMEVDNRYPSLIDEIINLILDTGNINSKVQLDLAIVSAFLQWKEEIISIEELINKIKQ
ncbi:MAG: hypothetical protein ACOX2H_01000 [Saccharofermentanales bacterium]